MLDIEQVAQDYAEGKIVSSYTQKLLIAYALEQHRKGQVKTIEDKAIDDKAFELGVQGFAYVDDPAGYRALVRSFAAEKPRFTGESLYSMYNGFWCKQGAGLDHWNKLQQFYSERWIELAAAINAK